jgi:molybdopterin molybdotransferase
VDLGILPDDARDDGARWRRPAAGQDLLVTSGGVSTGEADHVRPRSRARASWSSGGWP